MTVKELKAKLVNASDDMMVMVEVENHIKPGMFAFTFACPNSSGIATLGTSADGTAGGEEVFLILPHGSGIPEDEADDIKNLPPEVN